MKKEGKKIRKKDERNREITKTKRKWNNKQMKVKQQENKKKERKKAGTQSWMKRKGKIRKIQGKLKKIMK